MNRLTRSSINLFSGGAGYIIPMLINVITTPILLSKLGVEAYGIQSLVAVVIGYLTLMDLGLDLPITKFLAEDKACNDYKSASNLLNTTLQIYLVIGIVGMAVIVLLSNVLATKLFKISPTLIHDAKIVFQIAGIGFLGSIITSWGRAVAMGTQRLDISHGVSVLLNFLGASVGVGALFNGFGLIGYVTTRVFFSMMIGPMCIVLLRRNMPTVTLSFGLHRETLKRIGTFVGYGTANRAMGALFGRLDQTLVGVWIGVASSGIYAIPVMMTTSLSYLIAYMFGYVLPTASELSKIGETEKLKDITIRSMRFLCGVVSMTFIPLYCFGGTVLHLWVGEKIAISATPVLELLTISFYLTTLFTSVTTGTVIGMGFIRLFFFYSLIRNIIMICMYCLFIRPFGINGAGIAMFLTSLIDIGYFYYFFRIHFKLKLSNIIRFAFVLPLLLGLMLGFGLFCLRPYVHTWFILILVCCLFELAYIGFGFMLHVFGETEKRAISGVYNIILAKYNTNFK